MILEAFFETPAISLRGPYCPAPEIFVIFKHESAIIGGSRKEKEKIMLNIHQKANDQDEKEKGKDCILLRLLIHN